MLKAFESINSKKLRVLLLLAFILFYTHLHAQTITFTIDPKRTAQTIDNFGASGAWFTEGIGKYWPTEKKERLAELLFSKAFDKAGNPLGIGLSAWRFNIGGGTVEQGDSSGISNPLRRVECFLSPNGKYDWNKQQGYMWFVRQAKRYAVENLIAFSNTPPVQFNKNGLGFKLQKDYVSNLRDDRYDDYADFLATVIEHFDKEGLRFNYISPVNEPQWDWSNKFGQMNQEGSPWHNKDIYLITRSLDSALSSKKLSSKILITEAGNLTSLYEGNGHASRQIQTFYSTRSPYYVGNLKNVQPVIEGHSYFTDNGDTNLITVRAHLRDTASKYGVPFWQSEYSMLGDGFREGARGRISTMDCALFLSKIIHYDLTVANATAWHWWNAWEPGNADFNTRYLLIALKMNAANTDGDFTVTKNLWALGHYSRFIRRGMKRIVVDRGDKLNELQAAKDVMLSAFTDKEQVVVVAINYTNAGKEISINIPGVKQKKLVKQYVTSATADENMKPSVVSSLNRITLQARSIATFVIAK